MPCNGAATRHADRPQHMGVGLLRSAAIDSEFCRVLEDVRCPLGKVPLESLRRCRITSERRTVRCGVAIVSLPAGANEPMTCMDGTAAGLACLNSFIVSGPTIAAGWVITNITIVAEALTPIKEQRAS